MSENMPSILGQAKLPAHLQQYAGDQSNAAAGLITTFLALPHISIKGKQFRFVKEGVETPMPAGMPLKSILLGFDPPGKNCAKAWYKAAYQPGTAEAPDCFSSDGITPDPFVTSPVSRSCGECPYNAFGSGKDAQGNPSKGKACSDHKNLFVVAADQMDGDIAVLRVPATSLKALSGFGQELAKHGVPMQALVTEMSFTDDEHPQLTFRAESWLSEEDAKRMVDRGNSDELSRMKPSNNKGTAKPEAQTQMELALEDAPDVLTSPAAGRAVDAPPAVAPPPATTPVAPPAEPVKTMTAKAGEVTYDAFIQQKWTDDQLVANGYMTIL